MYNLNINYGHGVIVMYQRRVINSSKCSTLVSGVDNGEAVHVWGQAVYGESLPSSQFCSEPKTALKKQSLREKRQPTEWGEIFVNHVSDKGAVLKIHLETYSSTITDNPMRNYAKTLSRSFCKGLQMAQKLTNNIISHQRHAHQNHFTSTRVVIVKKDR